MPLVAITAQTSLPLPPRGFRWVGYSDNFAHVLLPAGWHLQTGRTDSGERMRLTPNQLPDVMRADRRYFTTGLTVLKRQPEEGKAFDIESVSAAYSQIESATVLSRSDVYRDEPFAWQRLLLRTTYPGDRQATMLLVQPVLNENTGTLLILTFEAPEKEWQKVSVIRDTLMSNYFIDNER